MLDDLPLHERRHRTTESQAQNPPKKKKEKKSPSVLRLPTPCRQGYLSRKGNRARSHGTRSHGCRCCREARENGRENEAFCWPSFKRGRREEQQGEEGDKLGQN